MTDQAARPYIGSSTSISAVDVPALYAGASFYSPVAGDSNRSMLSHWATDLLDRMGPVPLQLPHTMAPETTCVAVGVLGSATALADLPPAGDEFVEAVRRLAEHLNTEIGAVYPVAASSGGALVAVAAAAQLGVPLLDADGMGRTFAHVHHTAMQLAGHAPCPLVTVGPTGESVLVDRASGARADLLVRSTIETLGGWAALAAYPATAGELRRSALPGTVTRLADAGRLLVDGGLDSDLRLARLGAVTGCRRIGGGRVVELDHLTRPADLSTPSHPSSVVIDELGGGRRQLRIELRSEIVAVFADGELVAAVPDHVSLVDATGGALTTLDSLELGDVLTVLVTPADAIWYSPNGLAMVGLRTHGIDLEHPRERS